METLSRRDFLKVSSAMSGAAAVSGLTRGALPSALNTSGALPNILIFVFDAMSAANLSLYGYARKTTANLELFAERATVYHQHYSAGNFTTSGTASLLTGLYPWTHRAINQSGLVRRDLVDHNAFRVLGERYHRLAFSENLWPIYLLNQFHQDLEEILSPASFGLMNSMASDQVAAGVASGSRAIGDLLFQDGHAPASLLFGVAERLRLYETVARAPTQDYPSGLPHTETYAVFFKLKEVFDGLIATAESLVRPSAAYLHIWSPHDPYIPTKSFEGMFLNDGWIPEPKPSHRLVDPERHKSRATLDDQRRRYDEYIANLDAEFGRLIDALRTSGVLDTSYVIVTSDHGEQFERGFAGHGSPLLYDPVVRVPLVISAPGQSSRRDVHIPTASVDVVPTLAQLSGGPVPDWCEGQVLPGLGGAEDAERSLFMMEAKLDNPHKPFTQASFAMRRGRYKLIDYMGYPQYRVQHRFEMYDMASDPDELNNIYTETMSAAWSMKEELLARIARADALYVK